MRFIIAIAFSFLFTITEAQVFDAIIAKDGSGTHTSLASAISRLRTKSSGRYRIFIKEGKYEEKIIITLDNVSLIGENASKVIISWDDYSGDSEGHSTSTSYTMLVEGDDFYAENLTIENTAGNVGQAVALSTTGQRQAFKSCNLLGFQDTYYAKSGMQYFQDCYIEGATDFIFGEATAVFENCQINCVKGGQYITAPADTKLITQVDGSDFYHGLLFLSCDITADEDVPDNSYFLGRPWQPNSSSVYVECSLGNHIKPVGWSDWSNDNHLSAVFAEYKNTDSNGILIDISNRVSWSSQVTDALSEYYKNLDYFLNSWDPKVAFVKPDVPSTITVNTDLDNNAEITWSEMQDVAGYSIVVNDIMKWFADTNVYTDTSAVDANTYRIASISEYGVFSDLSESATFGAAKEILNLPEFKDYTIRNHQIIFTEKMSVRVHTIQGKMILDQQNTDVISLNSLAPGIYVISIVDHQGQLNSLKIAI